MGSANAKRVYDTPDKGVLWGWEVSAYVLTKAISAGTFLVYFLGSLLGLAVDPTFEYFVGAISLLFLAATGVLLIMDLDRPDRFLYVLLRPHWESWLVKGGYSITVFGGMLTAWIAGVYFGLPLLSTIGFWGAGASGLMVAIYTAFLFAQAKGRDFWQSPTMVFHMFVHSLMAGAAFVMVATSLIAVNLEWFELAKNILIGSIIANLLIMTVEVTITHPTQDAKTVVNMILNGRYANMFWIGVIALTNVLPVLLLIWGFGALMLPAAALAVVGIYITEKIWVEAPQRIPLT